MPYGIAHGDEFIRRHDDQRVRAFEVFARLQNAAHDVPVRKFVDEHRHRFRIDRRLKNGVVGDEVRAQFVRIGQIAVMRQRHLAALARKDDGLRVDQQTRPRRGIADVPDGDVALRKLLQIVSGKDVGNQSHALVIFDFVCVSHRDAAAFLPAVLKRI